MTKPRHHAKELYRQLRAMPWTQLWEVEATRFNRATGQERLEQVAVIRAVGAVFPESGAPEQREKVVEWLRQLLHDPEEKVRRYAMAALPKLGAGAGEEQELLNLLRSGTSEREVKFLGKTLDKIGGTATLQALETANALSPQTEQKVRASVARNQSPSTIVMDRVISGFAGLRIHLRGRKGLEDFVRQEVEAQGRFLITAVEPGLVAITSPGPFTLADLFTLRCFGTVGFVLGRVDPGGKSQEAYVEILASSITSPLARGLLEELTEGPIRYRLEFVAKGHQRGTVRAVVNRAFGCCPNILNDARQAPWAIDVHPLGRGRGESVELRPRLSPDPRQVHRLGDVPAASHPPLAACMTRLAGVQENESVWDPFCGSGLELIERTLLGPVRRIFGTDISEEAVEIAKRNFAAALPGAVEARFISCDFREFANLEKLGKSSLTLVITNPPLGRRVPIRNLRGLFDDLFAAAAALLAPGGRLILTNPFPMESPQPSLKLDFRQVVDLGGFTCRLERYRKVRDDGRQ
jgi:hypothetical protein